MKKNKQRILGFDFARGLAIVGMIIVNFKLVMVAETNTFLYQLIGVLSGKAAALFVVLAGVGMSLMYQSAKHKNNTYEIRKVKMRLLKRAAFLFIIGLSYYYIWPADILHYYGLYLSIGILFLSLSRAKLITVSLILIIGYSVLMLFFDYETGWDWSILEYTDFFTLSGFFRNLFLNGFHPVIPWFAFVLIGIWIGRIDFNDTAKRKRVTIYSFTMYIIFQSISWFLLSLISEWSPSETKDIQYLFGSSPMPPLFFYMITAASLAVFIISVSVYISKKFQNYLFIKQMISTGQLALSNYFFHVIFGMLSIYLLFGKLEYSFSIEFAFIYAILFSSAIIVLSHLWRKKFELGPIEYLMRKVTD